MFIIYQIIIVIINIIIIIIIIIIIDLFVGPGSACRNPDHDVTCSIPGNSTILNVD